MRDPKTDALTEIGPVDHLLGLLVADIQRSRTILRDSLDTGRPGNTTQVLEAREDFKEALERFVAALFEHRLPVPRQIKDELGLMRQLCAHGRAPYRNERTWPGQGT